MSGSSCLIWMHYDLETCMQMIVRWPSVIVTTCCAIPALGRGSNVSCTLVHMACFCRVASVPRLTLSLFAAMKRSNMRTIFLRLCHVLMGNRYPKLVRHVVLRHPLVPCGSLHSSIVGHITAPLSSVCLVMCGRYLLARTTSNCSPFCGRIGQGLTLWFRVACKSWRGLDFFAFLPFRYLDITPSTV